MKLICIIWLSVFSSYAFAQRHTFRLSVMGGLQSPFSQNFSEQKVKGLRFNVYEEKSFAGLQVEFERKNKKLTYYASFEGIMAGYAFKIKPEYGNCAPTYEHEGSSSMLYRFINAGYAFDVIKSRRDHSHKVRWSLRFYNGLGILIAQNTNLFEGALFGNSSPCFNFTGSHDIYNYNRIGFAIPLKLQLNLLRKQKPFLGVGLRYTKGLQGIVMSRATFNYNNDPPLESYMLSRGSTLGAYVFIPIVSVRSKK